MSAIDNPNRAWRFSFRERLWLIVAAILVLAFGVNLEVRTALRRVPMTDLGVFAVAGDTVRTGGSLYTVSDWHGWHYVYPPALAIAFVPLSHPVVPLPPLAKKVLRSADNTPWGYDFPGAPHYFGLNSENARFFAIVAVWYVISIALIALSSHALACALEGNRFAAPPPVSQPARRRWWALRVFPLLICLGSLLTDLSRGQTDILMLAAASFALYLTSFGRNFKAGLWLAVPATVKLFPVLLFIYPIWRRRWSMIAGAATGLALTLVLVPAVAFGPSRSIELYKDWLQILVKPALGQGADKSLIHELTGMQSTDNQSLLAFVHSWRYHNLSRDQRPPTAAAVERYIVYAAGLTLLLAAAAVFGPRRDDSPSDLLIMGGILMGLALIINPVTHNYYFLLLMPVISALAQHAMLDKSDRKTVFALGAFMLVDLIARLPRIGPWLRDAGVPLLTVMALLAAGGAILIQRRRSKQALSLAASGQLLPQFAE